MYYVNKVALLIANPISVWIVLCLAALFWKKYLRRLLVFALVWIAFWSTSVCQRMMCSFLELEKYPMVDIATLPKADAIVDLGGGMGGDTNCCAYADISEAADRPWHASRIWKAGKAPIVIPSGVGIDNTDAKFLSDLGVPESAIVVENESRNTEENARFVGRLLSSTSAVRSSGEKPKVLLVTSMSHMPRAMMIFKKCAPEIDCYPVACDYKSVCCWHPWGWGDFIPHVGTLCGNLVVWKECLGIVGYKLRGF